MRNYQRLFVILFTVLSFVVITGCGNSSTSEVDEVSNKDLLSTETGSDEAGASTSNNVEHVDSEDPDEAEGSTSYLGQVESEGSEDEAEFANANEEETAIANKEKAVNAGEEKSANSDNEINNKEVNDMSKEDYLKKLNEMEEEDRYSEVGTTMLELEQQEEERYQKWDDELNDIYGILQDQLSKEQMDELREEQREWIKYRDETAKESSLKYEGGSTEYLEYVATLASLTRERCYVLVAQYMN